MYNDCFAYTTKLKQITDAGCLHHIQHGIEKESLRIAHSGDIAQTWHSELLGAALTHPYITTDYSEALLEFITPVFEDIDDMLSFLSELHRYTIQYLDNELLFCNSMPAILKDDDHIPIARYGSSNFGHIKHIYRVGLGYRYGKAMQTIAGIHYNFSLPTQFWDYVSYGNNPDKSAAEGYMALIRNFKRYSWLLIYLFGASPVVDGSFLRGKQHQLEKLGDDTFYSPWATSLRMSRIGYTNELQDQLNINYNSIDAYIKTLSAAVNTPHANYEKIGVKHVNQYRQLSCNILQIENEYYNSIRPKCIMRYNERPLDALSRTVEYVEVRCLDINPQLPLGIDSETACFLDVFLTFCAIVDSPVISSQENQIIRQNFQKVVMTGRKTKLRINTFNKGRLQRISLQKQGKFLLDKMSAIAEALDTVHHNTRYSESLQKQLNKINDINLIPSAQILNQVEENGNSFIKTILKLSEQHCQYFRNKPLPPEREQYFQQLAAQSHKDQQKIEAEDDIPLSEFLQCYLN
ncbi:MAG: glutamate--cysteine ligase [Endozoicomonadaceae bacterium]|nr:glutamate--cysteine ligase [Endozoicomonadaceae bacterium]MCY4328863.1 glutamate--cysteine ligase [Endozoicomonadaceae bacterium]